MGFLYMFAGPLAAITRPIYGFIQNYGITLIIVTILVKLITLPLTIMSQKNVSKTQLIQPEMQKLQHKYRNDKNQLSIEMQKLYKKYDVNPLGGCLPLIVQMFILFGFINVVYNPLTHILQLTASQLEDLGIAKGVSQVALCGDPKIINGIKDFGFTPINFDFFGIDLTKMLRGNEGNILLWIFPALAVGSTFLSSYITKKQQKASNTNNQNDQAQSMSKGMLTFMPIMTAIFSYTMPIGMSLYWFVSTAVQLVQQEIITKVINNKVKNEMSIERKGRK